MSSVQCSRCLVTVHPGDTKGQCNICKRYYLIEKYHNKSSTDDKIEFVVKFRWKHSPIWNYEIKRE